ALVAAEQLQRIGWKIDIRLPFAEDNCSELTQKKLKALRVATPKLADTIGRASHTFILDGLLGTGAKSFLREPIRTAAREINRLRREENAFGRIGVVAGAKGFVGAALMTTAGALRAGAGLVEVFVPEEIYEIVASAAPVESMVKPVRRYRDLLEEKIDIWALGPGLGKERASEVLNLIENAQQPMVVDADGLNILADKIHTLRTCRGPRLLTTHPGEMKRLMEVGKMVRSGIARNFCDQFPVTLLLKGSRSIVCERGKPISYNTTGNPGMASGGMGAVLNR